MVVGIHQPNYIPWGGYFYKILKSNIFIFLDDVQYTKNGLINRNKIKTPNGAQWLTMPVHASITDLIKDITFVDQVWKRKNFASLEMNYRKAKYFNDYYPGIREIIEKEEVSPAALNRKLICHIAGILGAECKFCCSSEIEVGTAVSDERLIKLIQAVNGSVYLSGRGGANYQSEEKFRQQGIGLIYTDYVQKQYPQLWGEFEKNLSILDILFNCGADTRDIILNQ